jgi:tRNA A-37 threonylcarbamoyl transferase component Bud32
MVVRFSLALALSLFALFGFLDPFIIPRIQGPIWILRYGVACPVLLATFLFTYTRHFKRHLQTAPFVGVLIAGLIIIVMTALASVEGGALYYAGLLLAFAWIHGLARLYFRNATILSLILLVAYEITSLFIVPIPGLMLLSNSFFLVSAHIIGMFVSFNLEASFRRDFLQRRLIEQRSRELRESVGRLHAVERRVFDLERAAPQAIENLPRWTELIADEIRRAVVAAEVRVWRLEGDNVVALTPGVSIPPTAEAIRAGQEPQTDPRGRALVPVIGISGDIYGAIIVTAPSSWDELERRVVAGFGRHLGGALEIARMRDELAAAEAKREAVRQRMRERGVGTLQLCLKCGRCYDETHQQCDADGSALGQRLLPFRILDRYEFVKLIGQGGMGQVFLARDLKLLREVAIKVLHSDRVIDPEVRTQLAREARAVAQINHIGVVGIHDLGELEDGSAFLVMEFLAGRSLGETITRFGRGTPHQVARLLRQAAAGLGAAHRQGIVHLDLKPQNLFLSPGDDGFSVKILDFGVAHVTGADATTLTRGVGGLLGTPAYMAPEQVRGGHVDNRTDLYALAAVGYEALTAERVLKGRLTIAATLMAVLEEPVPDVSSVLPGVPAGVDRAFAHAMAKDLAARPPDVESWAAEIADALDQMPSTGGGWPDLTADKSESTVFSATRS